MVDRSKRKEKCHKNVSEYIEKQCIKTQHVKNQKVDDLSVETINTEEIYIDNKLFPTSIIPIKINESKTFTNCTGLYALGQSFAGTIRFENCQTLSLNLVNLVLTGSLEFINCNQVIVFKGSVNNPTGTAIYVENSTDITFSTINTRDTHQGVLIKNSQDIELRDQYMQNITGYGIRFEDSNNISINSLDIRLISKFSGEALVHGLRSESVFILKSSFYDIEYDDVEELEKSIIKIEENSFDVKITNISIVRVFYKSLQDSDLNVNHIFIKNSGSVVLGGLIIDGNGLEVSGNSKGVQNCVRVDDGNNIFIEPNLFTDNHVIGDANSLGLSMHAISVKNVIDMIIKGNKINSNYISGGNNSTEREVRAFYGEGGGNWVLAKVQANSSYFKDGTVGSTYGYEAKDVSLYVKFVDCMSNNNGYLDNTNTVYPSESGGFKVTGDVKDNSVDFVNCVSNSNTAGELVAGIYSTYDNTMAKGCISNDNFSSTGNSPVYSYLFPGTVNTIQTNVFLFNCSGNNHLLSGDTLGLFAGKTDLGDGLTLGVLNLEVKKCNFNTNDLGIHLVEVVGASLIGNFVNLNVSGLLLESCDFLSLFSNTAVNNQVVGYSIIDSPSSVVQKNLSQNNVIGFKDTTPGGNSYLSNNSKSNATNYDTPFTLSVFKLDTLTGLYSLVSGEPVVNVFTNLES